MEKNYNGVSQGLTIDLDSIDLLSFDYENYCDDDVRVTDIFNTLRKRRVCSTTVLNKLEGLINFAIANGVSEGREYMHTYNPEWNFNVECNKNGKVKYLAVFCNRPSNIELPDLTSICCLTDYECKKEKKVCTLNIDFNKIVPLCASAC